MLHESYLYHKLENVKSTSRQYITIQLNGNFKVFLEKVNIEIFLRTLFTELDIRVWILVLLGSLNLWVILLYNNIDGSYAIESFLCVN